MAQEDFIIELLKKIQADTAETRRPMESLEVRQAALEDHLKGLMTSVLGIHSDLHQINMRVDRIERQMGLVSA